MEAQTQAKTPESVALAKYVQPAEAGLANLETSVVRNGGGQIIKFDIRSDSQYQAAGTALTEGRSKRKEFYSFWKEDPGKSQSECQPGEGHGYFVRRLYESANSIFNMFDVRLQRIFGTAKEGGLLDIEMAHYRQKVEEKARVEAEARAAEERKRLEEEAANQRAAAEAERKRLEAIAEAERKKAEAERVKRLAAEQAAAKTNAEREAAEMKAEHERWEILKEELRKKSEAAAEAERQVKEAYAKEREAQNVVAIPDREVPQVAGVSVRKVWKAEVLDIGKLVKAIADGKAPLILVEANEAQCNKLAAAFGGQNPPPGMRFYETEQTSARKVK